MSPELHGGVFGFDTPQNEQPIAFEYARLVTNPIKTAHDLFGRAITRDHMLLSFATHKAVTALDRILSAVEEKGSVAWMSMLNFDNTDIVGRTYREGFEIARLFLITPHISFEPTLQEFYEGHRKEVVRTLVQHFSNLDTGRSYSINQMRDVYDHLHVHPRRDGDFEETVLLRRVASVAR